MAQGTVIAATSERQIVVSHLGAGRIAMLSISLSPARLPSSTGSDPPRRLITDGGNPSFRAISQGPFPGLCTHHAPRTTYLVPLTTHDSTFPYSTTTPVRS